jgi:cadmium resistance protein CadD (predicted permease)
MVTSGFNLNWLRFYGKDCGFVLIPLLLALSFTEIWILGFLQSSWVYTAAGIFSDLMGIWLACCGTYLMFLQEQQHVLSNHCKSTKVFIFFQISFLCWGSQHRVARFLPSADYTRWNFCLEFGVWCFVGFQISFVSMAKICSSIVPVRSVSLINRFDLDLELVLPLVSLSVWSSQDFSSMSQWFHLLRAALIFRWKSSVFVFVLKIFFCTWTI